MPTCADQAAESLFAVTCEATTRIIPTQAVIFARIRLAFVYF